MWGARRARLWRSLDKLRISTGNGRGSVCWIAPFVVVGAPAERGVSLGVVAGRTIGTAGEGCAVVEVRGGVQQRHQQALLLEAGPAFHQHQLQQIMGIVTSTEALQAADGGDQIVRSPLSQAPAPADAPEGVSNFPLMGVKKETQAVLTYIKQSPKKVNLVAELVRGMRVDDALMQMAVSTKRAAKVVAKVITSARANAIHNFGMDKDRLVVAEAFVGKDKYLKRLRIHGKGKAGKLTRPRCRLTVIVKELSAEREAELARIRVHKYHSKKIRGSITKLMPHRVLSTQWQWSLKPRKGSVSVE